MNEEKKNGNAIALFSYLGFLIIIPLLVDKDDPFVKFHIKQGLTLIIAFIIITIVGVVPILGWIVAFIGSIVCMVLALIGIINAVTGKEKELPIVGKYGEKFNF